MGTNEKRVCVQLGGTGGLYSIAVTYIFSICEQLNRSVGSSSQLLLFYSSNVKLSLRVFSIVTSLSLPNVMSSTEQQATLSPRGPIHPVNPSKPCLPQSCLHDDNNPHEHHAFLSSTPPPHQLVVTVAPCTKPISSHLLTALHFLQCVSLKWMDEL